MIKRRAGPSGTSIEGKGITTGAWVPPQSDTLGRDSNHGQPQRRLWSQENLKSAVCGGTKGQPVPSLASEVHEGTVLETMLAKGGYPEESRRERVRLEVGFEFNFNVTFFVFPMLVRPGRHLHYIENKQLL